MLTSFPCIIHLTQWGDKRKNCYVVTDNSEKQGVSATLKIIYQSTRLKFPEGLNVNQQGDGHLKPQLTM